jgi:hypothetical protein
MEFAAAPHGRRAGQANRRHDTEHAAADTTKCHEWSA